MKNKHDLWDEKSLRKTLTYRTTRWFLRQGIGALLAIIDAWDEDSEPTEGSKSE